jgi:hypothetical protein
LSNLKRDLKLIRLMLSEERRMNSAVIGKAQFLMFPVLILFMSLVIALSSTQLLRAMPMDQMYLILHSIILIYGLGVGGFALFGERMAERRVGEVTSLLEMPMIHPISFKEAFFAFYVKDIIYYMLYSIVPLIIGLALSIPLTGFRIVSVLFLLLTITVTFLLGISFSFFLSSMYVRWKAVFGAVVIAALAFFAGGFAGGFYDTTQFLPSIMLQRTADPLYLLISAALILLFSAVAILTIKVKLGKSSEKYVENLLQTVKKFSFAHSYSTLMAKDWIDLVRSRTLFPVVGAYLGPLAFLAIIFWFLGSVLQLPLHFNLIFYAGMIGFFGVSIYGWLNLLDTTAYFEVLPVKVTQLVRTKLMLFTIIAGIASTAFLIALAFLQAELDMLWISLLVAYSTTFYTVASTALLTGLRTNTYLFAAKTLGKFAAVVIPPLIALTILSLNYANSQLLSAAIILSLSGILALVAVFMYRRIEKRWGRESFTF